MTRAQLVSIFSRGWMIRRVAFVSVAVLSLLAAPSRSPAQDAGVSGIPPGPANARGSERHRQCGQSACDTAANNNPRYAAHRIPSCCLPNVPGAESGKDETDAVCDIQISSRGGPSGRQGARQAARPQDYKHLQGMLNPLPGVACRGGIEGTAAFRAITDASEYWIARLRACEGY